MEKVKRKTEYPVGKGCRQGILYEWGTRKKLNERKFTERKFFLPCSSVLSAHSAFLIIRKNKNLNLFSREKKKGGRLEVYFANSKNAFAVGVTGDFRRSSGR